MTAPTPSSSLPSCRAKQPQRTSDFLLKSFPALLALATGLMVTPASQAQIVTDASTPVIDTIPVGSPPLGGIASSPNGKQVYVAIEEGLSVAAINTATHQISSFIETPAGPLAVAVSPDGTTLYVTDESGEVDAIGLPTGDLLFNIPTGSDPQLPGVSPDNTMVYVPCFDGTLTILDYNSTTPVTNITLGGEPTQVVFNAEGTEAYVCNEKINGVSVIDTATNAVSTIATSGPTIGSAIRGTTLYVTSSSAVFVINTKTQKVETITITNPANTVFGIPALTPDGKYLYVPALETSTIPATFGQTVVVIDTKTKKAQGQPIEVGNAPVQIAVASEGNLGFVSNLESGTVSVIKLLK
jgi:YVTN family beta-propeller protein